ncbi:MAG: TonB-dependent receptor [Acidobacteria bacterium]|nr:TonB-dependent receptor [Acidobacteriota bacterium]
MNSFRLARLAAACRPIFLVSLIVTLGSPAVRLFAAGASLNGRVLDPLGAPIGAAKVTLVRDGQHVNDTTSDPRGEFSFAGLAEGRYQVEVIATGFEPRTSDAVFVSNAGRTTLDVALQIGTVVQHVVVTAAAGEVPQAQVGASVTVLDAALIDALGNTDLLEPLRTVPGVAVVQTGARGGATSLFVRGGASNFTKVLVDGVPANDIGGAFDLADLSTAGVDRVEMLRGSNSVLYGTDALTGVINITTKRGQTRVPEALLSIDGGNLGTSRGDVSLGGAVARFDYFTEFSHLQTDNSVPNNAYRNNSSASRFGAMLGTATSLSGTVRHIDTAFGSPNAFDYYGVADDSSQTKTATYASVAAQSQLSSRLTSTVRFSVADQSYHSVNPSPTGLRSDPSSFANYLGNVTTISGANGYSVTGRAILDYSGTYPSVFDSSVTRRLLYGEVGARVTSAFDLAGGVRLENEHGVSGTTSKTARANSGAFVEARGQAKGYLYVNGGLGFDDNEIFGFAWTPRVSVAAYLRKPAAAEAIGDTKLTFNAGKGIKEPSLFQELSSLYALVPSATASSLGIEPVGPERSRSVDAGIEQGVAGGHGRLRLAYFNNEFLDLIEYVSKGVLPQLGVPAAAAAASGFGAYVNSQSNSSSGVELSGEAKMGRVRILGAYTYVDAVVTKSFGSGALSPAVNPAFPGVKIGQYSPLVGNRPFRRPAHSGSLVFSYSDRKAQVSVAGYFVGRRDDSTFLSDQFFGYSMLLPNQDMDPAYQKFDVSGSYQIHPRLRWYVTAENAFNTTFEAAAGYPALGRAVRTGVTVRVGGR